MSFRYLTCCIDLADGQEIQDMRSHPKCHQITYRTMRRNCPDLLVWAKNRNYDRWLPLSKDWHVTYHKSYFRGEQCYYLVWSGIEFIWTEQ